MLENVASGLILAAVTGLTVLAYKNENGYKKLSLPLYIILCVIFVAMMIWNVSASRLYGELIPLIDPNKFAESEVVLNVFMFPTRTVIYTFLAIQFYLGFLLFLGDILKPSNKSK